jgi:hypothetical protein
MCVYSRLDRRSNVWIFDDEVDDLESMRYLFANKMQVKFKHVAENMKKDNLHVHNKYDLHEE